AAVLGAQPERRVLRRLGRHVRELGALAGPGGRTLALLAPRAGVLAGREVAGALLEVGRVRVAQLVRSHQQPGAGAALDGLRVAALALLELRHLAVLDDRQ